MQGDLVTVFGGSGFVGKAVVRALAKAGKRVRVATRRPHLAQDLRVMGDVGQVQLIQANVRDAPSVARALAGAQGAVNLVGLLYEKGRQSFSAVQADGAARVAQEAARAGIARLVHVSAIGADAASASAYGRTKAQAEAAARAALPSTVVLRPSIVFGPEDDFFNRFAAMAVSSPALPLIGGGATRFQPVYVGDVADAVLAALDRGDAVGRTYELGGPSVHTFKALLQFVLAQINRRRILAPLPFWAAETIGQGLDAAFRLLPLAPPLTRDQVVMLKADNVVAQGAATLADLGVAPLETIEAIVPSYLYRYRPYGQFQTTQAGV